MAAKPNEKLAMDWLISHLRWVWIVLAFLLIFIKPPHTQLDITLVYALPGLAVLYNLFIVALLFIGWYPSWISIVAIILDTIVAIILMWLMGGYNSPMLPILLFPVLVASVRFNPETGLLISALPMSIAYVASLIIEGDINRAAVSSVISQLAVLFGAGAVSGYLAQVRLKVRRERDEVEIKKLKVENDRAKAIYAMANTLSSTLNYQKVLTAMVDLAQLALAEASGNTEDRSTVGLILLFEGTGPTSALKLVSGRNYPRHDEGRKVSGQEGILGQAIYKAEVAIGNNVQNDPVLKNFMALQNCYSVICAPLRAGFDVYGVVLFANPQKNLYTKEHASILTIFCNQAIIPMQNAQLYADLEREQQKLLATEAQARKELARNLHDGPTQAVAAIAMRLNFIYKLLEREGNIPKAMDEVSKVEEIALRTTKEIRNMLFTLRPLVLETQGLSAAIEQYAERMKDLDNLNIELDVGNYNGELSTQEEGVIFAIIEEAVGNAKKHAKAEVIRIKLVTQPDFIIAQISDNGKGFNVEEVKASYDQRGSLGLINLEERAEMVGGRTRIQSAPGKGTSVTVEVPVKKKRY